MSKLIRIRQDLFDRQESLRLKLQRVERTRSHETAPLSPDFSEQAVQRENDEVLDRLAEATRDEIQQFIHAIDHLDRGLYGFCERCGDPIEAVRLSAIPQATRCSRCARQQERTAARSTAT